MHLLHPALQFGVRLSCIKQLQRLPCLRPLPADRRCARLTARPPACLPAAPIYRCRYGTVVQAEVFTAPGLNNDFQFAFVQMSCAAEAECALGALQASPRGPDSCCCRWACTGLACLPGQGLLAACPGS